MSANRARLLKAPPADSEILERLVAGELGALGELYDRHHASVRRFVSRATGDAADVDDIVHEAFLEAAKSAARYDGRTSCRPWLLGIAAHLIRRRRSAFGRFVALVASLRGQRSTSIDPRSRFDARTDIERALARLSEAKRITLLMAEVEGLSCQEIAEVLGVPIGTVWTRLHTARKDMRAAMEGSS